MTRCRHPGCLSLARTGIYCDLHRKARAAAKSRRQREREKERAAKRRKAREYAAIQLLVRLGYGITFPGGDLPRLKLKFRNGSTMTFLTDCRNDEDVVVPVTRHTPEAFPS